MKKTLSLIAAAMLLVGGVAFAEEAMLIDFTQLDADYELTLFRAWLIHRLLQHQ